LASHALSSDGLSSDPCHRSLYSYQMRTALALAIENPHLSVTFLPLGCSGATINAGFLNNQRARECPSPGTGAACSGRFAPRCKRNSLKEPAPGAPQ
jgi:hypothetical protein